MTETHDAQLKKGVSDFQTTEFPEEFTMFTMKVTCYPFTPRRIDPKNRCHVENAKKEEVIELFRPPHS